jgi:hypothetical protein
MPRNDSRSIMYASFFTLAVALIAMPASSHAAYGFEDEDTILVEKHPPSQKIPYSRIIRKIGQRLFKIDTQKVLQFGKGRKQGVARSFKDFADRSKYRVNVRQDKVVLKFTMNF